jgi:hypothetical protein
MPDELMSVMEVRIMWNRHLNTESPYGTDNHVGFVITKEAIMDEGHIGSTQDGCQPTIDKFSRGC